MDYIVYYTCDQGFDSCKITLWRPLTSCEQYDDIAKGIEVKKEVSNVNISSIISE